MLEAILSQSRRDFPLRPAHLTRSRFILPGCRQSAPREESSPIRLASPPSLAKRIDHIFTKRVHISVSFRDFKDSAICLKFSFVHAISGQPYKIGRTEDEHIQMRGFQLPIDDIHKHILHSLMFFGATVLRNGTGYLVVFQIFSIHP